MGSDQVFSGGWMRPSRNLGGHGADMELDGGRRGGGCMLLVNPRVALVVTLECSIIISLFLRTHTDQDQQPSMWY